MELTNISIEIKEIKTLKENNVVKNVYQIVISGNGISGSIRVNNRPNIAPGSNMILSLVNSQTILEPGIESPEITTDENTNELNLIVTEDSIEIPAESIEELNKKQTTNEEPKESNKELIKEQKDISEDSTETNENTVDKLLEETEEGFNNSK